MHMGRYGVYYRRHLGSQTQPTPGSLPQTELTSGPATDIVTASANALHESSADALIQEIKEKRAKIAWAPTVALLSAFLGGLSLIQELPILGSIVFVLGVGVALLFLAPRDRDQKTVRLEYDLEEDTKQKYSQLTAVLGVLGSAHHIWRVLREEGVLDPKYAAGASKLLNKKPAAVRHDPPKWLSANVDIWKLDLGGQSFCFFPDQILVCEGPDIGAVGYHELEIDIQDVRFIENAGVPSDSEVIDQTWRFTNKKDGPDRRFAQNPMIPIVRYGEIQLRSSEGLNLVLHVSNADKARQFANELRKYGEKKPSDRTPLSES